MNKRDFIKSLAFSATAMSFMSFTAGFKTGKREWNGEFTVPSEVAGYKELKSFAGSSTMKSHLELHKSYADNLNRNVRDLGIRGISTIEIFKNMSQYPAHLRVNAGGFFNHKLYWRVLSPKADTAVKGGILKALNRDFGSVENFKKEFTDKGLTLFGSGWLWLVSDNGRLKITSTEGNDNPLMDDVSDKGRPLMCLDLWEHAWDLDHQSNRESYINAFWGMADWSIVEKRYRIFLRQ